MDYPIAPVAPEFDILAGGMGAGVSNPFFVNSIAHLGVLGTVSGVAPEIIMAFTLQNGDPGGHYRRALATFPFQDKVALVLDTFLQESAGQPTSSSGSKIYRHPPFFTVDPPELLIALTICASYAFIWLAKEGHDKPVSFNCLEKISMPHIYSITGAVLARVDYITMGAGRPLQIPKLLDNLVTSNELSYTIPVEGRNITSYTMKFHPETFFGNRLPPLKRPGFIPIGSSTAWLSVIMNRMPKGFVGVVFEGSSAGGHNAPPRTKVPNAAGGFDLVYGTKDEVDFREVKETLKGIPFWIGGGMASPEKLRWAKSVGARGIQVGSIFAFCRESGMREDIKRRARALIYSGKFTVRTDMCFSPTGFPFQILQLEGTLSDKDIFDQRVPICSLGVLRRLYEKPDGTIGYRCPAEPGFIQKGGDPADIADTGCLCNGLMAAIGLNHDNEFPVITCGKDLSFMKDLSDAAGDPYSAAQAVEYLRG